MSIALDTVAHLIDVVNLGAIEALFHLCSLGRLLLTVANTNGFAVKVDIKGLDGCVDKMRELGPKLARKGLHKASALLETFGSLR